jgi:CubicO group peptidase (beta-lactamase class C family)
MRSARSQGFLVGVLLTGLAGGWLWAADPRPAGSLDRQADALVEREMARRNLPSVSLVVLKDGSILKQAAYGYARLDPPVAATGTTRYRLDSVTKQFTAAAILVLQQQQRLRIEDPVSRYLPDAPPSWKRIAIRDLLTHTAGFPRDTPSGYNDLAEQERSPEELLRRLYEITPLTSPGWRFLYSNAGYAVLGAIIETVSGQGYGEFLRANLFAPAGMSDTRLDDQNYDDPRLAMGYAWEPAFRQGVPGKPDAPGKLDFGLLGWKPGFSLPGQKGRWQPRNQGDSAAAAGSVQSTALDLARWETALHGGTILTEASKNQMWTPRPPGDGDDYGYGFGWYVQQCRAGRKIFHGGSGWGYSTAFHRYPEAGYTIIVLTNLQPGKNNYHADAIAAAIAALYDPRLADPGEAPAKPRLAAKRQRQTPAPSGY